MEKDLLQFDELSGQRFIVHSDKLIIIIIFIETRLQDTIGKIIKYRWHG